MRTRIALCALAVAALIAGCGGSRSTSSSTKASSTAAQKTRTTRQPVSGSLPNGYRMPAPPPPHPGAKVHELIIKDVKKGTGVELHAGDTAVVEFVLSDYNSGRVINKSWGKKKPYAVRIEKSVVIEGWAQGMPGMRVGGRRVLVIPPELGFTQNPEATVAGRTTYFDIVLLGVVRAQPQGVGGSSQGGSGAGQ